jgi:hypothetical protein
MKGTMDRYRDSKVHYQDKKKSTTNCKRTGCMDLEIRSDGCNALRIIFSSHDSEHPADATFDYGYEDCISFLLPLTMWKS